MLRVNLWFVVSLLTIKCLAVPSCDEVYDSDGGDLSIIVPHNVENELRMKILFYFPKALRSKSEVPDISLKTVDDVSEHIKQGNEISFKIKLKNRPNNNPSISRVSIGKSLVCASPDEGLIGAKVVKNKVFKLVQLSTRSSFEPESHKEPEEETKDWSNKCGNPKQATGYIINGHKRTPKRWPWVAAMYVDDKYACTANYISDRTAVTAAHCFRSGVSPEDIELYIFSDEFIKVTEFKKHPRFKMIPKYDIAIVKTDPVKVSGFVPICITDNVDSLLDHRGKILSWAPQANADEIDLYSAILPVIANNKCEADIGFTVPNHSFCVNQGSDTWICRGDSGGSFMIKNKDDKRWYMRGIVSNGVTDPDGDCSVGDSVIFTNVGHFYDFVKN